MAERWSIMYGKLRTSGSTREIAMKAAIAAFALVAATTLAGGAFAQTAQSQVDNPSVNVRQSQNYTSMVDHNAAFRNQRMHQECDPIQSDDLRRQCIESFGSTTNSGSSDQYNRSMRSGAGRGTR
jgi:hypothetical protein